MRRMPSHICRFKVLSVTSPHVIDNQGYLIHFVRGETDRVSPTFVAKNGEIDFSKMPEGSAVLHFKSGNDVPGCPYAAKLIQFEVSEYFPSSPRRTVGMAIVNCTPIIAKDPFLRSAQGLVTQKFRWNSTHYAEMTVAILVYEKGMAHLQFDPLILEWNKKRKNNGDPKKSLSPTSTKNQAKISKEPPQEKLRVMAREEANTLLISLEALQERQSRSGQDSVSAFPELTAEIEKLEEKRKTLVGSEGLANKIIQTRCNGCVSAQFRELHYQYRGNFIGATAAYLRNMALMHHYVPNEKKILEFLKSVNPETKSPKNEQNKKAEQTQAIEDIDKQLLGVQKEKETVEKKLNELQMSGNIENNMPHILSNSSRLDRLEQDMRKLENSKATLVKKALAASTIPKTSKKSSVPDAKKDSLPIESEVTEIKERIKMLNAKELESRKKINRMISVAITHIIAWARTKGMEEKSAPLPPSVDDLFSDPPASKSSAAAPSQPAQPQSERDALLNAFNNLGNESAQSPKHNKSDSEDSSSEKSSSSSSSDSDESDSADSHIGFRIVAKSPSEMIPKRDDLASNIFSIKPTITPQSNYLETDTLASSSERIGRDSFPRNPSEYKPSVRISAMQQDESSSSEDSDDDNEYSKPKNEGLGFRIVPLGPS